MSLGTQKHFAKVKQRMVNYVGYQEGFNYDGFVPHAPVAPKHRNLLDQIFGDGQKAPHASGHVKAPTSSRKHLDHLGLATPQAPRRGRKVSSTSDAK